MAKLHELLAVKPNLATQAKTTTADLTKTFTSKRHLFEMKLVTATPLSVDGVQVTEAQSSILTTVAKEAKWISGILSKAIDNSFQIDVANTTAKANIITEDGDTIATDVPTTALLQLEHDLQSLLEFAKSIPTLDPAKGFVIDSAQPEGTYKARDVAKVRTKKETQALVLYPATDKHPAQVEKISVDVPVANVLEQEWSALITPAIKGEIIDRCEILLRAVKKARAVANMTEIDTAANKIGSRLLDFVFKPLAV